MFKKRVTQSYAKIQYADVYLKGNRMVAQCQEAKINTKLCGISQKATSVKRVRQDFPKRKVKHGAHGTEGDADLSDATR